MAIPVLGICWKTATAFALGAGMAGGVMLQGKNREEEERRAREIEELRRNARCLTETTGALREVIALQQRAAEVELGLTHRIERFSETLAEMRLSQAGLQGSLDEKALDLKEAGKVRERLEQQLAAASRAAEEQGSAYNRAASVLSAAQEMNEKLRASLSEVQLGREATHQQLKDLKVEYGRLTEISTASEKSRRELLQALAQSEASTKVLEKQLFDLKETQGLYGSEIARLEQAVKDLICSRKEAHEISEKLPTASLEEVPRYRKFLDAYCEIGGDYDGELKFQVASQVSAHETKEEKIGRGDQSLGVLEEEQLARDTELALALSLGGAQI